MTPVDDPLSLIYASAAPTFLYRPEDGQIVAANAAAARLYGWAREDLEGSAVCDLSRDTARQREQRSAHLATQGWARFEARHVDAHNAGLEVEANCALVEIGGERLVHMTVADLTELKASEAAARRSHNRAEQILTDRTEKLQDALGRAHEITKAQREFVRTMQHELKTPLTIIGGCVRRLKRKKDLDPEFVRERAAEIEWCIANLDDLINFSLVVERMEAGGFELTCKAVRPAVYVQRLAERYADADPTCEFETDFQDADATAALDGHLFSQLVNNLIQNAIKYSPDGGVIRVSGWRDQTRYFIEVADQGIGIPEADQPYVFEKYRRGVNTQGISGSGIGLYHCRNIARLHGGEVEVRSAPGQGTAFRFDIPLAESEVGRRMLEKSADRAEPRGDDPEDPASDAPEFPKTADQAAE